MRWTLLMLLLLLLILPPRRWHRHASLLRRCKPLLRISLQHWAPAVVHKAIAILLLLIRIRIRSMLSHGGGPSTRLEPTAPGHTSARRRHTLVRWRRSTHSIRRRPISRIHTAAAAARCSSAPKTRGPAPHAVLLLVRLHRLAAWRRSARLPVVHDVHAQHGIIDREAPGGDWDGAHPRRRQECREGAVAVGVEVGTRRGQRAPVCSGSLTGYL